MNAFTFSCLRLLIFWIEMPIRWIWDVVHDSGFSLPWILIAAALCGTGILVDLVMRHMNHRADFKQEERQDGKQNQKQMEALQNSLPVFVDQSSVKNAYSDSQFVLESEPLFRNESAEEDLFSPVFDELLPVHPVQKQSAVEMTNDSADEEPRRRQRMEAPPVVLQPVMGGKQTVHVIQDGTPADSFGTFERIADRARHWIDLSDEDSGSYRKYQSSIKPSEAFFAPVYPEQDATEPQSPFGRR